MGCTVIDAADRRWSLLCAGLLGPAETEQLRAEASATETGRDLWNVFAPPEQRMAPSESTR